MPGSIHLFRITGTPTPENVKLKGNILWDVLELDWKGVNMILNQNKVNLPSSVTSFERNSKLDVLSRENLYSFILC